MSSEFHVHGAHEHLVEERAHQGHSLSQYIAIFTAILATAGAIVGYNISTKLNEVLITKNEAVLKKAEASDQWSFYQAKSGKAHLMEIATELVPPARAAHFREQIARYEDEKKEIKAKAEKLDKDAEVASELSNRDMPAVHRLEQGSALIQIGIALASITALTRRRWLFVAAGLAAAAGLGLAIMAFV